VGIRERPIDVGTARGRALTAKILGELRDGRLDRGLAGAEIARAVGLSAAQYSRIERGLSPGLTIQKACELLSAVGLELSAQAHPSGEPLRDKAHAALLDRFRANLHPSLRFRTEVPFPDPRDRRAWDAVVLGADWRHGVEAETRPRDRQALERRLALKLRDGDVAHMTVLLLDSRHLRAFVRAHAEVLREAFPLSGVRALELLAAGVEPGGSAIVLL
jgi:transcriptional regulator with XRE-family HTH domain